MTFGTLSSAHRCGGSLCFRREDRREVLAPSVLRVRHVLLSRQEGVDRELASGGLAFLLHAPPAYVEPG